MQLISSKIRVVLMGFAMFAVLFGAQAVSAQTTLDLGTNYATGIGLGTRDIRDTIAQTINVAMGFLGTIAVVIILFGGFKWMTSGGEQGKVEEARKLIIAGIVGLVIILASWAIANFVLSTLLKGTGAVTS